MAGGNREGETPELALNRLLDGGGRGTVATAESCTGGGVAARLTSVAGSSDYVLGGIVAYANAAKTGLLGVDPEIIATRGAVSEECALAMARGARGALGATWGVSTTGIAGPGGATPTKPVGLVWIAVSGPDGEEAARHVFPGDRAAVTAAATEEALRMLLRRVEAATDQPSR